MPFPALRYDLSRVSLADVAAPPYDVIDDDERARLAARSDHNAVRIDLPVDEGGVDRYRVANRLLAEWQDEGILGVEAGPAFYGYAMAYADDQGRARRTVGVIGAPELSPPGEAGILPHEHTTPKARSDRLGLLPACRANLSAVWGLSLSAGLTGLCGPEGDVLEAWTDEDGVGHELWAITDPDRRAAIAAAVGAEPVVIADGHHRYETSLAYRDERRADGGGGGVGDAASAEAAMAFVVGLADDALTVRPIHRLVSRLPGGFDLAAALGASFEVVGEGELRPDEGRAVLARMADEGALGLIDPGDRYQLLRPRPGAFPGVEGLDSARLAHALEAVPHEVAYQHGVANVARRVLDGSAQHGVLLRPATVAQIAANAHAARRMPPKTTFFHPKPRTGPVFRLL